MTHKEKQLRAELRWLRARYDSDKVSPGVYATIKELETQIAWAEFRELAVERREGT